MSEVVISVEAFTDRNLKSPEEMVLTLQRNVDKILTLPDQELNRFMVNYIIRSFHSITSMYMQPWKEEEMNGSVCGPTFWKTAMDIQQKKEDRKNGMAKK
jgi:hypothetical protein